MEPNKTSTATPTAAWNLVLDCLSIRSVGGLTSMSMINGFSIESGESNKEASGTGISLKAGRPEDGLRLNAGQFIGDDRRSAGAGLVRLIESFLDVFDGAS